RTDNPSKIVSYLFSWCPSSILGPLEGFLENNCPHIVVGTPIRILDLIQSNSLNIGNFRHFVLDECDRLMGNSEMHDSVVKIFNFTSKPMQFLSFDVLNQKTKKKLQAIYKKTYN
ncbi:hypothetical protein PRIPAC_94048, partial [Pristionchus pacificus]|uniref:Helicase n=1 Tax=Pristionchus pacificus TaxID=54126 RepID=A0A2A6CHW0_PRIPA